MLNEYHLQFLRTFADRGTRFLVIGGQAKYLHYGSATKDLDIWVDLSADNLSALEKSLAEWSSEHPLHTATPLLPPLQLRPNVQIKFPDDDCAYVKRSGELAEISPAEGIDILTSIADLDFDAFYQRSSQVTVDGITFHIAAEDDLSMLETIRP